MKVIDFVTHIVAILINDADGSADGFYVRLMVESLEIETFQLLIGLGVFMS